MNSGRLRMHYVERGEGPLVLLLHGFPESWWSWRHQIEPLAAAGYRVVAPDQRGYAETEKKGPYDVDTLAADIALLIEHLGEERAIVVGHDWGGTVAFHLAATRPERVSKLVVLNAPHPAAFTRTLLTSPRQLRRSWYVFFFVLPLLPERALTADDGRRVDAIVRASAADRSRVSHEELAPFRRAIVAPGAAHAMVGWYRAAFLRFLRYARSYPTIVVPTRILWGNGDPALGFDQVVPPMKRWLRDVEVHALDGVGHYLHAEAPERVNPLLIEILASTDDGKRLAIE